MSLCLAWQIWINHYLCYFPDFITSSPRTQQNNQNISNLIYSKFAFQIKPKNQKTKSEFPHSKQIILSYKIVTHNAKTTKQNSIQIKF